MFPLGITATDKHKRKSEKAKKNKKKQNKTKAIEKCSLSLVHGNDLCWRRHIKGVNWLDPSYLRTGDTAQGEMGT